jgi:hypothetical protein
MKRSGIRDDRGTVPRIPLRSIQATLASPQPRPNVSRLRGYQPDCSAHEATRNAGFFDSDHPGFRILHPGYLASSGLRWLARNDEAGETRHVACYRGTGGKSLAQITCLTPFLRIGCQNSWHRQDVGHRPPVTLA